MRDFTISNLYLAAYLRTCGLSFLRIESARSPDPQRLNFVFSDDPTRQTLLDEYYSGRASVNALHFVECVQNLKALIRLYQSPSHREPVT